VTVLLSGFGWNFRNAMESFKCDPVAVMEWRIEQNFSRSE